jgi:hypothetical protein
MTAAVTDPSAILEERPRAAVNRRTVVVIWLILSLALPAFAPHRYLLSGDPDKYVLLAGAMSRGEPYEVNGRPETRFSPGFPGLLVPAALFARDDFGVASRWAAFLSALVFPLTYWWAARRGSRFPLAIATATVSSTTFLQLATGNPMADPAFTAVSLAFLGWADAWEREPAPKSWGNALLGAILLTAAVAIRSAGIALIAAYALAVAVRAITGRQGAHRVIPRALPLLTSIAYLWAWSWWANHIHRPLYPGDATNSYMQYVTLLDPHQPALGRASMVEVFGRLLPGLRAQAAHAGELLTQIPSIAPVWFSPLVALPLLLVLAGLVQDIRRHELLVPAYLVGYGVLLALWPFDEGRRFLLPALPLLLCYVGRGLGRLADAVRAGDARVQRWLIAVGSVCLAGVLITVVRQQAGPSRQQLFSVGVWSILLAGAAFARRPVAARWSRMMGDRSAVWVTGLTIAFTAAGIVQVAPALAANAKDTGPEEITAAALNRAATWMRSNTPDSAIVQAGWSSRLHAATHRRVVPFPHSTEAFVEIDREFSPQYLVVLDPTANPYVRPTDPERLTALRAALRTEPMLVHTFVGGSIYALR